MSAIKQLVGQTAIYGLSSMLGRLLNYFLVPLHTLRLSTQEYGVITEVYATIGFLAILLIYGMETAFFRYYHKHEQTNRVIATALFAVLCSTVLFWLFSSLFFNDIVTVLKYEQFPEYITLLLLIVGVDALCAIPQANLRAKNRPVWFASVNLISILVNIGLNIFFIGFCMKWHTSGEHNFWVDTFYNPHIGFGYIFVANLFASIVKLALLSPQYAYLKHKVSTKLLTNMLRYAWPLLLMGLAGMINETLDRILLKHLLTPEIGLEAAQAQEGIYGACYKLSILITLFVQAFRFAAEPFFFNQYKQADSEQIYAKVMSIFIGFCLFMFLAVCLFLPFLKHFLQRETYWEGLHVVPVLLIANICLGVVYNLSVWYKLSDKTRYGAILAGVGALITLSINFIFIPTYGYTASAWATLFCYATMMVLSYLIGRRHMPIPYPLKKIAMYALIAGSIFLANGFLFDTDASVVGTILKSLILIGFGIIVWISEKPKKVVI